MGYPCLGLVVKLQSHDPPGHWPGCGGVGRWPSFCCCWRDPEGQRLLWLPGPGAMVALGQESKRGPARGNTLPHRSQAHRYGLCTNTCPLLTYAWGQGTDALYSTAHTCTRMHAHAQTTCPTLHTCPDTKPTQTQTHSHYTHVRLLSHTLLSPSTSLSHAHTHLPPGSLTAHCPGESEQINHEKPPLPATRHAQVQFGWGGLQAGSSGGPLGSGWRGA